MESPKLEQAREEITIKDLILKVQGWVRYLWKKWLIILIAGIAGAALGIVYSLVKNTNYEAELTFVLEDSKSNALGMYAGIASQFGVDLGSATGSGIFSGDNIMEFLKSRLMVERTLLSPVTYKGKQKSLADIYIEINELKEDWKNEPGLKNISFPFTQNRKSLSIQQDSILKVLHEDIVRKRLNISKPDKKLSFISVKCTTRDEVFSKFFTERLVKEATDFYVQTKTMRSKANVDKLQATADSVERLLNRKTYSVAVAQDLNMNPVRNIAGVATELQARQKIVLETMYGEVVKNLEISKMTMAQETPIIQIVDVPIFPLEEKKIGKFKGLVLGGFLFGFLAIAVLIVRKVFQEIMV